MNLRQGHAIVQPLEGRDGPARCLHRRLRLSQHAVGVDEIHVRLREQLIVAEFFRRGTDLVEHVHGGRRLVLLDVRQAFEETALERILRHAELLQSSRPAKEAARGRDRADAPRSARRGAGRPAAKARLARSSCDGSRPPRARTRSRFPRDGRDTGRRRRRSSRSRPENSHARRRDRSRAAGSR